ncbi:hypothetical protein C5167_003126 [Papaver somniferum]|uniref:Uncharacterized protein n=1 Tax=Papaver somniferum TaxID=3469 RepID=A0A4Y7L2R2_PAPSO|nr:hypothetical protein C5167_003126 [Papaver somniferum]
MEFEEELSIIGFILEHKIVKAIRPVGSLEGYILYAGNGNRRMGLDT